MAAVLFSWLRDRKMCELSGAFEAARTGPSPVAE